MFRNRKIGTILLGLVMTISLAGCDAAASLVTDTGSGKEEEIPKEDYLDATVMEGMEKPDTDALYKVITLAEGTYKEEAIEQILRRSYINIPTERFSLDGITATFGEYLVEDNQYVREGDALVTVFTEVDEIAIEELEIKIQRLQERYQAAETRMTLDLQNITDEKWKNYNVLERDIKDIEFAQRKMDWEREKASYEEQIKAAKEELKKLTQIGEIYEVKSDMEGFVSFSRKYSAGDAVSDGGYICHITNSSEVYVTTEQQSDKFHYGMEVIFDDDGEITQGTVVGGGSWLLYGNLNPRQTIFHLNFQKDVSELGNSLRMRGTLKTVENVVLVPVDAVSVQDNEYFVTVLNDDGTLLKTEFLPGGSNKEYYWVLEGLTEGTRIIYN